MSKYTIIKLLEDKTVRSIWNEEEEKSYFSIVDIIAILSNQIAFTQVTKYQIQKQDTQFQLNTLFSLECFTKI